MPEAILEARGLWKTFGTKSVFQGAGTRHRPALIDACLGLQRGQILGIVGESGSGKTTLARCLSLLMRPDSGQVILLGEDLTALPVRELRRRRRRIQTVFQDPYGSLNPRMQVGEAVGEVLRVHSLVPRTQIRKRVEELLDSVGISPSFADRYPSDFSGGQRQRICIARALAAEPDVLIADEAVSALDVSVRAQVLNLLLDLRDRLGLSIVFIGHDLFVVSFVADVIAVMLGGQIIEILPKLVSLNGGAHPYTRELLAAAPALSLGAVEWLRDEEVVAPEEPPIVSCPYLLRCPIRSDARCVQEYPPLRAIGPDHWVASFCELPNIAVPKQDRPTALFDSKETASRGVIP